MAKKEGLVPTAWLQPIRRVNGPWLLPQSLSAFNPVLELFPAFLQAGSTFFRISGGGIPLFSSKPCSLSRPIGHASVLTGEVSVGGLTLAGLSLAQVSLPPSSVGLEGKVSSRRKPPRQLPSYPPSPSQALFLLLLPPLRSLSGALPTVEPSKGSPTTEHPLSHSSSPLTPTLDFPWTALASPGKPRPSSVSAVPLVLAPPSDSPWACDRVCTASPNLNWPRMSEGLPMVCCLPGGGGKEGRGRG